MSTEPTPITSNDAEAVSTPVVLAPLSDLRAQINNHHQRALSLGNASLDYAHKCGQALRDAKSQVTHGKWLPWLLKNCPSVSDRQCQKYMRLAKEWGRIETEREIHPGEITSVDGALGLISEPERETANTNSDFVFEPSSGEPAVGDSTTSALVVNHDTNRQPDTAPAPRLHEKTGQPPAIAAGSTRAAKTNAKPSPKAKPKRSRPQEQPELSSEQLQTALLARADSIVRYTIPKLVQTAKAIDKFLTERESPGVDIASLTYQQKVDIAGMLRHQEELTLIFNDARAAVSPPKKDVLQ